MVYDFACAGCFLARELNLKLKLDLKIKHAESFLQDPEASDSLQE